MIKIILGGTLTGLVLGLTGHVLVNADEIARDNCLETAICYKADSLK